MENTNKAHDLLVLVDATCSMTSAVASLRRSLPQIISLSILTGCFDRIGLLAYHDYDTQVLNWSGWYKPSQDPDNESGLITMVKSLRVSGGGDYPEALKTALAKACDVMNPENETIVLIYTDAPPHTSMENWRSLTKKELEALEPPWAFGGFGPKCRAWNSACKTMQQRGARVFSFIDRGIRNSDLDFFAYISDITDGICIQLGYGDPRAISDITINTLLTWMEVQKDGSTQDVSSHGDLICTPAQSTLNLLGTAFEKMEKSQEPVRPKSIWEDREKLTETSPFDWKTLKSFLPVRESPLMNFAKRYAQDQEYRQIVMKELSHIIESDVLAISANPVFGPLWRVVCVDRENEQRESLISQFGHAVESIPNSDDKAAMKKWLEESYDYTAEIVSLIESVPASEKFPFVCLDPTALQQKPSSRMALDGEDEEENNFKFTRDDLLEIGRSCNFKILRRLSRLLTSLTYVESAETMPVHLVRTSEEDLPKIPCILASPKYDRKFWKIFLHLVLPGTYLSARSAAVLAALAIRIGLKPLMPAAEEELLKQKNRWRDLAVPETWNTNCLSLLLDANNVHQLSHEPTTSEGLLRTDDCQLFTKLVDYKLLENNLNTTLLAQIGWTPQKSTLPVGPTAHCESCKYERSITIMGSEKVCGMCLSEYENEAEKQSKIECRATDSELPWVECSVPSCRVQYVVYAVESLNVRPKCHFCRANSGVPEESHIPAPWLQCVRCSNRMLYPEEYRSEMVEFFCVACTSNRQTIVEQETKARSLSEENGSAWLLDDRGLDLIQRFENRSAYRIASDVDLDVLADITILPARDFALTIRSKPVHNPAAIQQQLRSWVNNRRVEAGHCSLCFSTTKKRDLLPACGRRGCFQYVDRACLQGWYGSNAPGKIINTAALHCPFCRRQPTQKILAANGAGVHAIAGLAVAVQHTGEWIYAWCNECGNAKEYMERVCAPDGQRPEELTDWTCHECEATARESSSGAPQQRWRPCPGCGVMTEKISGCDHISCPTCETHWCFFCGEAQERDEIYSHMKKEHGGYYGGQQLQDDDDDDDDVCYGIFE